MERKHDAAINCVCVCVRVCCTIQLNSHYRLCVTVSVLDVSLHADKTSYTSPVQADRTSYTSPVLGGFGRFVCSSLPLARLNLLIPFFEKQNRFSSECKIPN